MCTVTEFCVSTFPAASTDSKVIVCEPSFEPLDGAGMRTLVAVLRPAAVDLVQRVAHARARIGRVERHRSRRSPRSR